MLAWGFCPAANAAAQTAAEAERYQSILRTFRRSKPVAPAFVPFEQAWTLTLPSAPSAPGPLDRERLYVPLREGRLVALRRETGLLEWTRDIEVTMTPEAGGDALFLVSGGSLRALDAATGADRWSVPIEAAVAAPPVWDAGWLLVVVEPGEVLALRASDGALMWRRSIGAPSPYAAVPGGRNAVFVSTSDSRVVALALDTGALLWTRALPGALSPPAVAKDRVFVGSTDNTFYALDPATGRDQWKWRNGGDVIGAAVDGDVVYFASLDNVIRAVNRGNGNQRWRKPTGSRPVLPPRAFRGVVVLPGLMPAISVFVGETGASMGVYAPAGALIGPPLIDAAVKPFQVSCVTITREGVVEALRPAAMMFREAAATPVAALPGRALTRERME
ncbi:MAG: PQQ-binding-like beta-propeller repeat protein [Acidobacteria bacterium]|nr:PQQ-binding-like beta-propeller repeat protein [Acidobacteriota bacterium]